MLGRREGEKRVLRATCVRTHARLCVQRGIGSGKSSVEFITGGHLFLPSLRVHLVHRCSLREEARGLRVTDSRFQSAVVCSLPTFRAENSLVVLRPG